MVDTCQYQAGHQGVVMGRGDEGGDKEGVGQHQPVSSYAIDTVEARQFRHVVGDKPHSDEGNQSKEIEGGIYGITGDLGYPFFDEQKDGAVGRSRFGPHLVGTVLEEVIDGRNPVLVGDKP